MKQDYEKPELIVYEDLSDVTMQVSMAVRRANIKYPILYKGRSIL